MRFNKTRCRQMDGIFSDRFRTLLSCITKGTTYEGLGPDVLPILQILSKEYIPQEEKFHKSGISYATYSDRSRFDILYFHKILGVLTLSKRASGGPSTSYRELTITIPSLDSLPRAVIDDPQQNQRFWELFILSVSGPFFLNPRDNLLFKNTSKTMLASELIAEVRAKITPEILDKTLTNLRSMETTSMISTLETMNV